MFGGAGGLSNPWVPSDIEIRNNHFFKDPAWAAPGITLPPHNQWAVKNNLEFKSGRRVLVDGNLIENVWASAQMGFSIMLTPRTNSSGLLAVVDDITISNNILKNVSSGFDTLESDNGCVPSKGCTNPGEMRRVTFDNNLILLGDTRQPGYGGQAYGFGGLIVHGVTDFVVQHNTIVPPPNLGYCRGSLYFESPPGPGSSTHNVWILDNMLCRQINGPQGMNRLNAYMSDPSTPPNDITQRFKGNVMYLAPADKAQDYPRDNFSTDVGPKNPDVGEYRLKYPAKMEKSEGAIAGVDKSKLSSAYSAESGIKLATRSETLTGTPDTKQ